jgi:putative transposase
MFSGILETAKEGSTDKRVRLKEAEITAISKQAEVGRNVRGFCYQHSISEDTCCNWKSKYGGMESSDVWQLKELEQENRQLTQYEYRSGP